ncbi:DNA-directed DNA polymerase [Tanacetum coccineum]|uniref:DNA-directed DNA polymerase n=1 Tax=Tanacetum coccineum TaxID=301880 RepID=A0ABQ5A925_9ASTR
MAYPLPLNTAYPSFCLIQRAASGLRPYHFTYPERKLTMEEMLYKFIDKGKREHEDMREFILINNTPTIDYEVKGMTTREGKTTTQDAQNNNTSVHTEEPHAVNHDELVESEEVLTNDQPQKTSEPVAQPSNKIQMPPIPFPQRLRKEKEEAQQKKFFENLKQLHINLPFIEALAQMPKYDKFLKGLGEPKATRMSLELADRSIQYPRGIIENVLIKVDKFVLLIDFIILDMPEDSRVPIILGRLFLATVRAMIDVFNKKIMLRVRDDEVIFDVDQSIKRPPIEDDECYGIDDLDNTINAEAQELLANDEPDSFLSRGLEKSIDQSDLEGCEPIECNTDSDSNEPIRGIASINTPYSVVQETTELVKVERGHLYSASANEINEKKPELKDLPNHLEYAYLHGDKSFPIIISSELSDK